MGKLVGNTVQIRQQFLRSIRIDADYGRLDALNGFVLQPSARLALETLAKHINQTQQRAFTWTGPYGTGKSSLALALASLVHQDKRIQNAAKAVLSLDRGDSILKAFDAVPGSGWTVIPVVGRRSQVHTEISTAMQQLPGRKRTAGRRDVVNALVQLAERGSNRGVLLIIDELGKFLENAAQNGGDIFFFQQLAEAACRARGKLVIIGILHQAFEAYASRLGRNVRDEWAKVQGRFVDIALSGGTDEIIELIGRAINVAQDCHPETMAIASAVAQSIASRRPGISEGLAGRLDRCWPLHPVTAVLLGPCFRRQFGQNERSVFGFLNSVEPMGFREYLDGAELRPHAYYHPAQFWDYLKANFEAAIFASPDGHRWAIGLDAVERTEAKGNRLHVALIKTIAIIELFRNGTGLVADDATLSSCFPSNSEAEIRKALDQLKSWSVGIFRRHLGAWGVYSGSDFDIEAALTKARAGIDVDDFEIVRGLGDLAPVLAKRIYQETGAMRFLKRTVARPAALDEHLAHIDSGMFSGEFILLLPDRFSTAKAAHSLAKVKASGLRGRGIILGVPEQGTRIAETAHEISSLRKVYSESTQLEADKVAAREIDARISTLRSELDELLRESFTSAKWYWEDEVFSGPESKSLASIASRVVEGKYPQAPTLLSELINRDAPSSNSVKARRDLMHRMLTHAHEPQLGYDGFPPDAGIYFSILQATTIHREAEGTWAFREPSSSGRGRSVRPLWKAADKQIKRPDCSISLDQVYQIWRQPPFGVKAGVLPIVALSYFLSNRSCLALYHEGMFVPELSDVHVDEWLQDPSRISWKFFEIDYAKADVVQAVSQSVFGSISGSCAPSPLEAARGLVSLVLRLPEWTKRTNTIGDRTKQIRNALLRASDPHRVLFVDLPAILGGVQESFGEAIGDCISELSGAYAGMLRAVEDRLFEALDHRGELGQLRHRGATVSGISGDFRLDAFALRIAEYQGRREDIEALISLAASKPEREWNDRDIELAYMQLGTWALDFRRVEALAPLRNRPATRHSFAVVFGPGTGREAVSASYDISLSDVEDVARIARDILGHQQTVKHDIFLAALAEAGALAVKERSKERRI